MDRIVSVSASSGEAVGRIKMRNGGVQFTTVPTSASGTATVTCVPEGANAYESVFDTDGIALTYDLSVQKTHFVAGAITHLKVASDNSSDTFTLIMAL